MKKKLLIIIGVLILLLGILLVVYLFRGKKVVHLNKHEDFTYINNYYDEMVEENRVFTNYEDYYNAFESDAFSKEDFVNNNYVVITLKYNSCGEQNVTPVSYNINGNNIEVKVQYEVRCGVCAPVYKYYLLKVDKNIKEANVNYKYENLNEVDCDPNISYKPMIYIYPEEDMEVNIKLGYPELLTTTYPEYDNGWNVFVKKNGDIIYNNRSYYGLYWEGNNNIHEDFNDGFVVNKDELINFFEDKLAILGLNEREINEFIVYWLPILNNNEYNLIRFLEIDKINNEMPLEINPEPDTLIRVLMEYKKLDKKIDIKEQKLDAKIRNDYTVIEWGGTKIK